MFLCSFFARCDIVSSHVPRQQVIPIPSTSIPPPVAACCQLRAAGASANSWCFWCNAISGRSVEARPTHHLLHYPPPSWNCAPVVVTLHERSLCSTTLRTYKSHLLKPVFGRCPCHRPSWSGGALILSGKRVRVSMWETSDESCKVMLAGGSPSGGQ